MSAARCRSFGAPKELDGAKTRVGPVNAQAGREPRYEKCAEGSRQQETGDQQGHAEHRGSGVHDRADRAGEIGEPSSSGIR